MATLTRRRGTAVPAPDPVEEPLGGVVVEGAPGVRLHDGTVHWYGPGRELSVSKEAGRDARTGEGLERAARGVDEARVRGRGVLQRTGRGARRVARLAVEVVRRRDLTGERT